MENYDLSRERKDGLLLWQKDFLGHKMAKPFKVMMKSLRSDYYFVFPHLGSIDGCLKIMDLLYLLTQFHMISFDLPSALGGFTIASFFFF